MITYEVILGEEQRHSVGWTRADIERHLAHGAKAFRYLNEATGHAYGSLQDILWWANNCHDLQIDASDVKDGEIDSMDAYEWIEAMVDVER